MISVYGLSGSFGSRVRSKSIEHKIYTVRRNNFRSKPTPINEPFHKSDLNFSYPIIHFIKVTTSSCKKTNLLFFL